MVKEKVYVMPMVIEEREVGEEPDPAKPRSVFIYKRGEHAPYPALAYSKSFVYTSGGRLYSTYVKTVSGVYHLFLNDKSIGPIYGSLYGIVFNGQNHGLAVQLADGTHAFLVLDGRRTVYQLTSVKRGFLSKKVCNVTHVDVGLVGDKIIALAHTRGAPGTKCKDIIIYSKNEEEYVYKEYEKLVLGGWNGLWFSYIEITNKNLNIHFHLWDGSVKKYSVPKSLIPEQFLLPNSIIYYDHEHGIIVLNSTIELIGVDLKEKTVLWRKSYGETINTPYINTGMEEILVYHSNNVYILDPLTGNELSSVEAPSNVTAASLSMQYLLIGSNEILYLYARKGKEFSYLTKYSITGSIRGITIQGDDVLIGYRSPGNTPKIIYTNLGDTISFKLKDIELTVNGVVEIPIEEIIPRIRVLKITSPQLLITTRENKIIIADRGSKPGEYKATVEISIAGFLPVIDDIRIKVEELKSVFKKLRIQSTIIPSQLGPFLPITIDSLVPIDELYMVLTTKDNSVYGTTNIIRNIKRGETFIPLYIIWAKMGVHTADLKIVGWSRRNRIFEEFKTKIKIEYDIPPFHLRVAGGVTYIWSPFSIEAVKITLRSRNAEYTIMHDLKRGWNEIETHGLIPEEVIITLRGGITYVVRRGQSWIQLMKRSY